MPGVTINALGTSSSTFKISKSGPVIKQGTDRTSESGSSGDLYIQRGTEPDLFQYANSTWRQVGTDVTGTLTHRAKGSSTVLRYQYLLHGSTTDATPTQLTVDGLSEKVLVPSDCVGFFDTQIMGVAADGSDQVVYRVRGTVNNTAGTITLVGTNIEEVLTEEGLDLTADISANDSIDSIEITVTGDSATTFRWAATVELMMVNFGS